jgi:hypothetical protein
LYNAYQTDIPSKVDFVDKVGRWKIRWALVDDKPETTRFFTCNKPSLKTGYIQHHHYLTDNAGVIDKREIFECN